MSMYSFLGSFLLSWNTTIPAGLALRPGDPTRPSYNAQTGTMKDSFLGSFLLGWGITIGAGLASYPIDTIRRRMMMTSGQAVKYNSSWHCATVRAVPCYAMPVLWCAVQQCAA